MTFAGLGWMPWRMALALTAGLLVLMAVLALSKRTRPGVRVAGEVALVLGLYAVWQVAGTFSKVGTDQAYDAGMLIADIERALRWPSEAVVQQVVLGNETLVRLADAYYASLHLPVFVVTMCWVLVLHRRDWPFARTVVVLVTAACLFIQFKAVAPPRLLPQLGIVDTAAENGRSVYAAVAGANQLAAMPSVHIAWACVVAMMIIISARSRWRWLAILYPCLTMVVVVVTGNHFWLDGVAAIVLLGAAVAVTLYFPSQRPARLERFFERAGQDERVPVSDRAG